MGRDGNASARAVVANGSTMAPPSSSRRVDKSLSITFSSSGESLLSPTKRVKSLCCRTLYCFRFADQSKKTCWRDRHLRNADVQGRERIFNSRYDRGGSWDDANFADAFDAQRIMRRRRLLVEGLHARHVLRRRQEIVGKGRGDRLTGFVITHPFEHGVADAMGNAAVNLTLDDHRIDQPAGILDGDVADNAHASGFDVDFHFDNVTGI